MSTTDVLVAMHRRAVDTATTLVDRVSPPELQRSTPCAGWNVGDLLGHMIGQHVGFARAVADGDAELVDFRPASVDGLEVLVQQWHDSTGKLLGVFAGSSGEETVRLVEIDAKRTFEFADVLGMQILDTAVHSWDLATALGGTFELEDDILDCVEKVADRIPSGAARTVTAAFAQPQPVASQDRWTRVLAHLGRSVRPPSVTGTVGDRSGLPGSMGP